MFMPGGIGPIIMSNVWRRRAGMRFCPGTAVSALFYGERYLDLMSFVTDDAGRVRVFTPDHHFISADCRHLSLGGAKFFAERIEWGRFLPMQ